MTNLDRVQLVCLVAQAILIAAGVACDRLIEGRLGIFLVALALFAWGIVLGIDLAKERP